jgi:hypothetical protein
MANEIYNSTWWGLPTPDGWGNIYYPYIDPTPFIEIVSEIGDFLLSEQGEYIIIE